MDTKKLRQKILDLAIHGKLVPQDPNDEPASVLLERIRKQKEQLVKDGKLKKKDLEVTPVSEDEKPFDIPESWEWCRLGEISSYAMSKKKVNAISANSSLWVLDLEDIEKGGKLLRKQTVGESKAIGDKTYFEKGDILYSKLRPYLLKILLAPDSGICTPEIIPFRCYGCVDSEYVVPLLKSAYVSDYINAVSFGVKMPRVSTETMVSLVIPLPPLAEQKRIATKIESIFSVVDIIESCEKDLQQSILSAKSKILDLAIRGKLVPQDPNDEPASELLKRLGITSDIRPYENNVIPKGWSKCLLEDITDYEQPQKYIVESTDYSNDYPTPVLTPGKSFIIGYTNETKGIFDDFPVIIFDDFTTESKYVDFPFKVKSSAMKILHVKNGINIRYVTYYMSITRLSGNTHKRYWISEYSKLPIPIPPINEQNRIIVQLDKLFAQLDSIASMLA